MNTNKDWIAGYEELLNILGSGMTAALIGQRGTGKTQMAVELIRHACFQEITSRYKMTMDFFMDLKESYDNKAIITESEIIKAYISPQLLVLDEIHERGDSSWENRLMTHMINKRYGAMKDTVLISNQTPEVFGKSIGNSILSRLNETGAIIVCNWESFRK